MTDAKAAWGFFGKYPNDTEGGAKKFMKHGFIGIGWPRAGDLSKYPKSVAPFRSQIEKFADRSGWKRPQDRKAYVTKWGKFVYSFVHEIADHDIVVLHTTFNDSVNIGHVTGPYAFDDSFDDEYRHLRSVKWMKTIPKKSIQSDVLKSIRQQWSFFRIPLTSIALLKA